MALLFPCEGLLFSFLFTLSLPRTMILANGVTEIKNWQRQHLQQVLQETNPDVWI